MRVRKEENWRFPIDGNGAWTEREALYADFLEAASNGRGRKSALRAGHWWGSIRRAAINAGRI